MKNFASSAIFLIAACAICTGAWGQKVYRCGASYSNIPCAGAVTVDTADARSKTQKTQSDNSTARDSTVANTMETARKQDEARAIAQSNAGLRAEQLKTEKAAKKAKGEDAAKATASETAGLAAKKKAKKKKEPEFFTAKSASEPKANAKDGAAPAAQ